MNKALALLAIGIVLASKPKAPDAGYATAITDSLWKVAPVTSFTFAPWNGPRAIINCDGGCGVAELDGGWTPATPRFCEIAAAAIRSAYGSCR